MPSLHEDSHGATELPTLTVNYVSLFSGIDGVVGDESSVSWPLVKGLYICCS